MARKRKTSVIDSSKSLDNPKRELFCRYYGSDKRFFGNATTSYMAAYYPEALGMDRNSAEFKQAMKMANKLGPNLLVNIGIKERIKVIQNDYMSDEVVDRELHKVIIQDEELSAKVSAIKVRAQITGRIKSGVQLQQNFLFGEIVKEAYEQAKKKLEN